jgi:hypothetical protein
MALGTSNTSAQARGKNKATKIKKRKEIEAASDWTAFQGSARQGSQACGVSNGNVNITYYHDQASSALPMLTGTKVYTSQRYNPKYYAENGHYKIGPDRGRYSNIEIVDGALRANATPCP